MRVKALVREAVGAGFYNIDVDTSTLVDLSKQTHAEQQRLNYEVGVDILKDVRARRAAGRDDLGRRRDRRGRHARTRTVEELRAFMDGFNRDAAAAPASRGSRRSACRPARRTAASCSPTARSPT